MEGDTEVGGTPDAWIAKQSRHHRPRCLAVIKQDLYGGCGCEVVEVTSCHGCKGRLTWGGHGGCRYEVDTQTGMAMSEKENMMFGS